MALITCNECGNKISSSASACPSCGAPVISYEPNKRHLWLWALALVVVYFIMHSIFSNQDDSVATGTNSTQAATQQDPVEHIRFLKTEIAAKTLKNALRDPNSLSWDSIMANDDGSVVCLEYRARNGFGGMNKEFAVFVHGKPSQDAKIWNKNCANKPLNDMLYVRNGI